MERYEAPEMKIIYFQTEDVITTSSIIDPPPIGGGDNENED